MAGPLESIVRDDMCRSMSIDVGVWALAESEDEPFARGRSAGDLKDSGSIRCELRFFCTIMLTAQAARSTGVRLAAWMKGSVSCSY